MGISSSQLESMDNSIAEFDDENECQNSYSDSNETDDSVNRVRAKAEIYLLREESRELLKDTYKDFISFRTKILNFLLWYVSLLSIAILAFIVYIVFDKKDVAAYEQLMQLLIGGLLIQVISIFYFITKYIFSTQEFQQIQEFVTRSHLIK